MNIGRRKTADLETISFHKPDDAPPFRRGKSLSNLQTNNSSHYSRKRSPKVTRSPRISATSATDAGPVGISSCGHRLNTQSNQKLIKQSSRNGFIQSEDASRVQFFNTTESEVNHTEATRLRQCYNSKESEILEDCRSSKRATPGRSFEAIRKSKGRVSVAAGLVQPRDISMISDHVLLGGRQEAANLGLLKRYGVSHILNVAQQIPAQYCNEFVYVKIPLIDANGINILEWKDTIVRFVAHVEAVDGRVFIHCLSGVSRSVAALAIFCIVRHRIPLQEIFRYLSSIRPQICPNEGFKLQLAQLEISTLGYSSVARDKDMMWDFYSWNMLKGSVRTEKPPDDTELTEESWREPPCCRIT